MNADLLNTPISKLALRTIDGVTTPLIEMLPTMTLHLKPWQTFSEVLAWSVWPSEIVKIGEDHG